MATAKGNKNNRTQDQSPKSGVVAFSPKGKFAPKQGAGPNKPLQGPTGVPQFPVKGAGKPAKKRSRGK